MRSLENTDIFEAVYYQHAEDGTGQNSAQVLDKSWCLFSRRENNEWQKTRKHGGQRTYCDRKNLLG